MCRRIEIEAEQSARVDFVRDTGKCRQYDSQMRHLLGDTWHEVGYYLILVLIPSTPRIDLCVDNKIPVARRRNGNPMAG